MNVTSTAERATFAGAMLRPFTHDISAMWNRLSLRAKLLLVFVLVDVIAGCVIGGVTVMRARTSTRVEMPLRWRWLKHWLLKQSVSQIGRQSDRSLSMLRTSA